MFPTFFLCLILCAALEAQPRLPKRGAPASPSGENKPAGSNLSPAQQRNVEKLKGAPEAIKGKSQVTPQMKQQLAADLTAMAEGATKPSQATTQKLVDDLTAADKNLSSREVAQLSNDSYKALNSADAARIASDLKAIGVEVQKTAHGAEPGEVRKKFERK